jgi:hypothetical protein
VTRYTIDPPTLLALARAGYAGTADQLVAPAGLRSQAMSLLYAELRAGTLAEADVRPLLDAITTITVRLLGDRMSRGTAWRLARELDLADTGPAEYLAVTRLQADALVALDPVLARLADGVVPLASIDALLPARPR